MPRDPIPTWFFVVTVVRNGDSFLLVHERDHGQLWYLPGGRVETGETVQEAALRETLEETGIPIRLTGVVRIEHYPIPKGARVRVFFVGEPTTTAPPKATPDAESLGAAWVSVADLSSYSFRDSEVVELLRYISDGGPTYPLTILRTEGSP